MMRNALVLLILLGSISLAACGKKKSPAAPANSADTTQSTEQDREEKDAAKPDDPDAAGAKSSDPCEGGE